MQTAAESALALDGFRSDPNARFGLTVRISDPTAKVKRTDEGNAVLFVGGLTSKTTEQDVRTLIEAVSLISSPNADWTERCCKQLEIGLGSSKSDLQRICVCHHGFRSESLAFAWLINRPMPKRH